MAWLAVDSNGSETIFAEKPIRSKCNVWFARVVFSINTDSETITNDSSFIELPQGSIKKLIGRDLTWEDGQVEI